jgi:thiamine pyrophosphate-dependent acetolactate synthase large subunit-like protein
MTHPSRTGGQILVDALHVHGVDTAFGVPGESYLDVLDACTTQASASSSTARKGARPSWPRPTAS